MSSLLREIERANRHDDVSVAVRTIGQCVAQQASAAMYFLAFMAVWATVFFLALR